MLLLLCMAACKPEPDCTNYPPKVVYGLHKDDSMYVPYKGHDTLTYQRTDTSGNILDTVTLYGQENVYEEKFIDNTIAGCKQALYSNNCSIKFVDKANRTHINYKYLPQSSTTYFEVWFQDSILFTYIDWNVANKANPGYMPLMTICGRDYYTINRITPSGYELTDPYILYIDEHGLIVKISTKHIVYNLIQQ